MASSSSSSSSLSEKALLLQAQIRFKLESLLDNITSKGDNNSNINHDDLINDDNNDENNEDKNHINIIEKDAKQSHLVLAKETAEALVQELRQKSFRNEKMLLAKDAIIAQSKDDNRKLKAENESLYKQNNAMQADIIKIERYKKVLGAEQDVFNKAIEMLKETSINLKHELSELQNNYEFSLRQVQDNIKKNKSLLSSLEQMSTINENLKNTINNERVINSITKAELNSHDTKYKLLNDRCNRYEEHNKSLIIDLAKSHEKNKELQDRFEILTAASSAISDTLTHAKSQHTLLFNANNDINIMKDKEISSLMEKVEMLQTLVDNKSDNNTTNNDINISEEHKTAVKANDTVTISKTDDLSNTSINIDSNAQVTTTTKKETKKVTFLHKFGNDDSPIKRMRNDYDENNDQYNKSDNLLLQSSPSSNCQSNCPLCCEEAYGLMTTCRRCSQKYHSTCAKKLSHFSKHFLCELCHVDDDDDDNNEK